MIKEIQKVYGVREGLEIRGDKIEKWPYEAPQPTKAELDNFKNLEVSLESEIKEKERLFQLWCEQKKQELYDVEKAK